MAENYVLLETIQLTENAASVTFDNIPQTGYTDLKVVCSSRDDRSGQPNGDLTLRVAYNGTTNTGSIYTMKRLGGSGASAFSDGAATTSLPFGMSTSTTATANVYGNSEFYITNYTSSTSKSFSAEGASENNATTAFTALNAGLIATNNPITGIVIFPFLASNFIAGSTFSLYGIAALGTTPIVSPKATGGDIVTSDSSYWYHTFLSSGTFTPQTTLTCELLVVAGGGGGGRTVGGGGGAGGLLGFNSELLTATSYAVAIGAGGAGAYTFDTYGGNGSNSRFGSLTVAVGGGASMGAKNGTNPGLSGGSGGGAPGGGDTNNTGGSASPSGQGNAGGNGLGPSQGGGGGGGAGGVGGNAVADTNAGHGGVGSSAYSAWGLATATGQNSGGTVYYAGGGGGGSNSGAGGIAAGNGGLGGGAAGKAQASAGVPTAATANTGGGGGGSGGNGDTSNGGTGGSGIVIIRYPK